MGIEEAAEILSRRRLAGLAVGPLSAGDRPNDLSSAYAIQERVHEHLAPSRYGKRIGWKIGCTTAVMQTYLGIATPCAAGLFAGTRHENAAALSARDFSRIGVECEIAIRLDRDLDGRGGRPSLETVAAAAGAAMAAIEIVDDRYEDWRSLGAPTLIADDFFAAGCVLGPAVPIAALPDLATLAGVTRINGEERGRGLGADVLGHPFAALAFLAETLAARGKILKAGEIVLTGSLVETRWLQRSDRAEIAIDGLGSLALTVDD